MANAVHQINFKPRESNPLERSLYEWLRSFEHQKSDVIRLALTLLKACKQDILMPDLQDHAVDDYDVVIKSAKDGRILMYIRRNAVHISIWIR